MSRSTLQPRSVFHTDEINNKRKFREEQGAGLGLLQHAHWVCSEHGGNAPRVGGALLRFLGPKEVVIMSLHPVCERATIHLREHL